MTALIEARRVTKVFGGGLFSRSASLVAVDDLSLAIEEAPPTITAIVGESGSGKTTFARLILGLAEPTHGEVSYRGVDLRRLDRDQRRQFLRDVQVIFQDPYEVYNPFYRVDHVLEEPVSNFRLAKSKAQGRELIEEALRSVGLRPEETLGRYPHQLSGGQRQRVMVARALLLRPRVIIADEPVSMIDASLRATVIESLRDLNRQFGISLIYITHDLTTAYQISENIVVLYRGAVAEAGDVERVVKEPEHPYTRLLIGSIPRPDPKHPWVLREKVPGTTGNDRSGRLGCLFADRCPNVMAICREKIPPLYQTAPHRATACFLYNESPVAASGNLNEIFVAPAGGPQASPEPEGLRRGHA
ncbi:MAG: ATP-binding cassette domain-containing protein [Anaerolineae bacterium]|nr:ATP-binding cassette domain-containing protein [Anaerolineae bacterium]